jgi:hypothetical protein
VRTVRVTHSNWVNDWLAGEAGDIRFLTDEQAHEAVNIHHLAVYADDGPQPAPVAEPVLVIEPSALSDSDIDEQGPVLQADIPGETAEVKAPWTNAPKAAWVDWAVHEGADPAQAASMTKNELIGRYGERL